MNPLDEIKHLYFNATKATIQRDLTRAIVLLKAMKSEEERERAAVYMDGLSQMQRMGDGGPIEGSGPWKEGPVLGAAPVPPQPLAELSTGSVLSTSSARNHARRATIIPH